MGAPESSVIANSKTDLYGYNVYPPFYERFVEDPQIQLQRTDREGVFFWGELIEDSGRWALNLAAACSPRLSFDYLESADPRFRDRHWTCRHGTHSSCSAEKLPWQVYDGFRRAVSWRCYLAVLTFLPGFLRHPLGQKLPSLQGFWSTETFVETSWA